jgi:hypothetical protein
MTIPYTAPKVGEKAFNCPNCGAYAQQVWAQMRRSLAGRGTLNVGQWWIAACEHCDGYSFWVDGAMHYPDVQTAPLPSVDLPDEIKCDYEEARSISDRSPRGAAALLRLAIQKLCIHLGGDGKNLNYDIGYLMSKGLPSAVQKSLDAVRVIGNDAVHPGTIDLRDDPALVAMLFRLVNLIAEKMITEPKQVDEIYALLPEGKRKQIEERDKK